MNMQKLKAFFLVGAAIFIGGASTKAYFSSAASIVNSRFATVELSPTETASATTTVTPDLSKSIVINELMWMGSVGNVQDEWIELRNTSSSTINISNWQITGLSNSGVEESLINIPSGKTITPNGFFLISRKTKAVSAINVDPDLVSNDALLSNTKLMIRLYSGDWTKSSNLVDTAGNGGVPTVGSNGTNKESMSRNSTPGDGSLPSSWHADTSSNSTTYWDGVDGNFGTPGGPNA
jgi:hypothetical protein